MWKVGKIVPSAEGQTGDAVALNLTVPVDGVSAVGGGRRRDSGNSLRRSRGARPSPPRMGAPANTKGKGMRSRTRAAKIVGSILAIITLAGLTPARVVGQTCAGDCDGSGTVDIAELVRGVTIALGSRPLGDCLEFDRSGNGGVEINELVAAVSNALCACRPCPTPPPTRTFTRTPTPTITPTRIPPTAPPVGTVLFREAWERAQVARYAPDSFLTGDTGAWAVGDTISSFPEDCGVSPNYGEVIIEQGSKRLRLHSERTDTDCSDNVFIGPITLDPPAPRVLQIPADADVYFSFTEHSTLNNPDGCDAVMVELAFDEGLNVLTYVLERGSTWDRNQSACENITVQNTFLLPPDQGTYVRNPRADLVSLGFQPRQVITSVAMAVDSHGDATFDDVMFFSRFTRPPVTATPTPTRRPDGCIRVQQGVWCFEFPGLGAEDNLTQSGCIVTFADASIRGPLSGNFWSINNPDFEVKMEGIFSGNPATKFTGTISIPGGSGSVSGQAGPCPE